MSTNSIGSARTASRRAWSWPTSKTRRRHRRLRKRRLSRRPGRSPPPEREPARTAALPSRLAEASPSRGSLSAGWPASTIWRRIGTPEEGLVDVRLEDKVAIITGAGGGMGRKAATMFAAEGARVVCVDVSEEMAESAADEVRAAGGQATAVAADVSNESQAERVVDHAVSTFGRVDALYNNAGIMPAADHSVVDTDVDTWDKAMAVNVRGAYLGCDYGIPRMLENGSGSIINVAYFVAILGCSVPQDAYTASKG